MSATSRIYLPISAACMLHSVAFAGEWEMAGNISFDARIFANDAKLSEQKSNNGPSLAVEPEWYYISDNDADIITLRPFMRIDPHDSARTHFDIRQADWLHEAGDWSVRAGFGRVFWGVTESNHLVDIINQTDAVEDVDGEDKLGQPMLQLTKPTEIGTFSLFYLPYFRERTFASASGRLRSSARVDVTQTSYDSGAEEWNPDLALRYEHTFSDWDVGIAHFHGTSREAVFLAGTDSFGDSVLTPHYDLIDQSSLDLQYTTDSTLWKLEALTRSGQGARFGAVSGGFEYSFYNIADSGADIGVLMEYHNDNNRDANAPQTLLNNDLFIGTRIVMNNASDTEFLGGAMLDKDGNEKSFVAEFSHRLNDNWKLEADLRIYADIPANAPAAALAGDDHVQIRLARYF